ncbi:MAG: radical SAM protein, partial [Nakamurella sp.]
MPSTLPDGDPVPADGSLPAQAYAAMADRTLSFYLHVPFCATRCGYCDFNTYTAGELGSAASPQSWLDAALSEIDLAAKVLGAGGQQRPVSTVFVGGGTPSLVGAGPLTELLGAVRARFGLTVDAEVTTEANPESTDPKLLALLRAAGYTRLSLGMQSTSSRVLQILDRTHTAGRALQVVDWARAAGFEHVNLDLIYGTPGETDAEFSESLRAAVGSGVDHISA